MKVLSIILISFSLLNPTAKWMTDFETAKREALQNDKIILLNFSGSDWCGPCIRLKKEIFESEVFNTYASQNIVLVNADFPRLKKNKLAPALSQQNDSLASIYNKDGKFPLTLLLTASGKLLREWDGFPDESPEDFVRQIKNVADAIH